MEKADRAMYSMVYFMHRTQDLRLIKWVNAIYFTNFIYVVRPTLEFYRWSIVYRIDHGEMSHLNLGLDYDCCDTVGTVVVAPVFVLDSPDAWMSSRELDGRFVLPDHSLTSKCKEMFGEHTRRSLYYYLVTQPTNMDTRTGLPSGQIGSRLSLYRNGRGFESRQFAG